MPTRCGEVIVWPDFRAPEVLARKRPVQLLFELSLDVSVGPPFLQHLSQRRPCSSVDLLWHTCLLGHVDVDDLAKLAGVFSVAVVDLPVPLPIDAFLLATDAAGLEHAAAGVLEKPANKTGSIVELDLRGVLLGVSIELLEASRPLLPDAPAFRLLVPDHSPLPLQLQLLFPILPRAARWPEVLLDVGATTFGHVLLFDLHSVATIKFLVFQLLSCHTDLTNLRRLKLPHAAPQFLARPL
jgi:hypothetical protein